MTTHSSQLMRSLAALGLLVFLLGPAMQYGAIWHHRAHPIPNVKVLLRDGRLLNGTLSREWSKAWVVTLPEGGRIQFDEGGYDWMEFKTPEQAGSAMSTLLENWRGFLPLLLVSLACLALLLPAVPFAQRHVRQD